MADKKTLVDALHTALASENAISLISVTTDPGCGVSHSVKEFTNTEELDFIDIRCAQLDESELVNGLPAVRHVLMSEKPVVILLDEVGPYTFYKAQKIITQIHEQAAGKVLVVLVGLRKDSEDRVCDPLPEYIQKHGFSTVQIGPFEITESFIEFLRKQKKSDTHLKVADFIEKNGLSGATPQQWQLFAITQEMKLDHAAACGLGDMELAQRFVEWQPGQGKTVQ